MYGLKGLFGEFFQTFTECHWSDGFSKKGRSMRFVVRIMGKKQVLKILRRDGTVSGQIAEVGVKAASASRAGSKEVE